MLFTKATAGDGSRHNGSDVLKIRQLSNANLWSYVASRKGFSCVIFVQLSIHIIFTRFEAARVFKYGFEKGHCVIFYRVLGQKKNSLLESLHCLMQEQQPDFNVVLFIYSFIVI